jgi:hypothetical protein
MTETGLLLKGPPEDKLGRLFVLSKAATPLNVFQSMSLSCRPQGPPLPSLPVPIYHFWSTSLGQCAAAEAPVLGSSDSARVFSLPESRVYNGVPLHRGSLRSFMVPQAWRSQSQALAADI